ncbi:MAG: putative Fe-S cluster assembly protein SufT [Mariprofundaceae bacterium]|nr:putative Fe-S cluster assembly protein SufT [Mariprofundaceae bacterium]
MSVHIGETRNVLRDCEALLIPMGTPVTIPEGSRVMITQALGSSYTVNINGNLARVESGNADALGLEDPAESNTESNTEAAPKDVSGPVDEDELWKAMEQCYDPEIPVNIVDLGLIYHCDIAPVDKENAAAGNRVEVVMTLTAAGCGMGPILVEDVRARLLDVANISDVHVELVFDPPWDRSMMSDEARLALGMF